MASPTLQADSSSDWTGRIINHAEFAVRLSAKRATLGDADMPRNTGNRRNPSKKALLQALSQLGEKW